MTDLDVMTARLDVSASKELFSQLAAQISLKQPSRTDLIEIYTKQSEKMTEAYSTIYQLEKEFLIATKRNADLERLLLDIKADNNALVQENIKLNEVADELRKNL